MVKTGDRKHDFRFIVYRKHGNKITRKCTGTSTWKFMKLLMGFLFLSSNGNYYVCRFLPTIDSTPVQLLTTGLVNTGSVITKFITYYCQIDQGGLIYVLVVENVSSTVVLYNYLAIL